MGRDHSVSLAQIGPNANPLDELRTAPPDYGAHRLDRLYADIDPSGYMTPLDVRPVSTERGVGITGSFAADPSSTSYVPSPEDLQERLTRLQENEEAHNGLGHLIRRQRTIQGDVVDHGDTPSTGHERHEYVQYDMEALSKKPSYQTAVRTPLSAGLGDGPPTYEEVTSRPHSPGSGSPGMTRQATARRISPSERS